MTTHMWQGTEELRGSVKGSVLGPESPGYEEARQVWNAMIDRRPAVIVQCAEADDVPPAIRFARKNGLELCFARKVCRFARKICHCVKKRALLR